MHKVTLITQEEANSGKAEITILEAIQRVINGEAGSAVIGDTVEEAMDGFEAHAFNRRDPEPVVYRITVIRHDGPSVG